MPIDTSMYNRPPITNLDGSDAFQQGLSMRKMLNQQGQDQAIRSAYQQGMVQKPDGSMGQDTKTTFAALAAVDPRQAQEFQTNARANDMANAKALRERTIQDNELIARIAPTIKDQASYEAGLAQAQKAGADISQWPKQYDPVLVQRAHGMALSTKDQDDLANKKREMDIQEKNYQDNHADKRSQIQFRQGTLEQSRQAHADQKADSELMKIQSMAQSARGQPAVQQAEKDVYAARKFDSLLNLNGDPNNLDPRMVKLAAAEIGKMAQGGSPTMDELKGLNPSNIPKALAETAQMFTANPTPANQGALLLEFKKYSNALKGDAQGIIEENYGRILNPYASKYKDNQIYQSFRNEYVDRFKEKPGKADAHEKTAQGPMAPVPPAEHPQANQALKWAQENPTSPKAKAILQRLGQ